MVLASTILDKQCQSLGASGASLMDRMRMLDYVANGNYNTMRNAEVSKRGAKMTKELGEVTKKWNTEKTPLFGWTCKSIAPVRK